MKVYLQKLYSNARRKGLHKTIDRFGIVRNYAVRMMDGYYRMTGKSLTAFSLSNHIAKKKRNPLCKTAMMVEGLDAQAVQECIGRVYKGYQNFFRVLRKKKGGGHIGSNRVRKPHVRKPWKNRSFTLLQCGYKFNDDRSRVRIQGKWYGIFKSQEIKGKVKRLTIKRDRCGDIWIAVLTDWNECEDAPRTGRAAGFDFGLKRFLTGSDGFDIECPQYLKNDMKKYRRLSSRVGKKVLGSRNRKKARRALSRFLRHITNKREDWQWKTARMLAWRYDIICLEDLNLEGMKRLWGRKVSDLAFSGFVEKLKYMCAKMDKTLVFVDRWCPTSQQCSECGAKNPITKDLRIREWVCPHCGKVHDRDRNAAINIYREGMSSLRRGSVRPRSERSVA